MIAPEKVHLDASNKIIITYIFIGVRENGIKQKSLSSTVEQQSAADSSEDGNVLSGNTSSMRAY
jgi:hypothetical protein